LLAWQTSKSGIRLRVTPSPTFQREPMVVAPGLPGRRNGSRPMTLSPLTSPRQHDMLSRMRHGSRRRTLKSGVRLRVTSTLPLQQRSWRLAGPQRGRALSQSGSAQAAVNRLSLRSGLGHRTVAAVRAAALPPPLVGRPQRHLLHAVRGKRICDLTLLRNKGHPTAAIVCSRPPLRIIRRRHARTQRSLTTHTLCARGQHFSHVVLYTWRSTASHAIPAAGCDLAPTGAPVLLP